MHGKEPGSCHKAEFSNYINVFVFLCQGYDTGSGGWVDKEGEKPFRITERDAVNEGGQQGIFYEEVLPGTSCLSSGLSQTATLASGDVKESSWSFGTSRDLAKTPFIPRPMTPKPAGPISAREHPGLDLGLLNFIGGAAS